MGAKNIFSLLLRIELKMIDWVQVSGNIVAQESTDWKTKRLDCWLCFNGVNGLIIQGSGTINGKGSPWWQVSYSICIIN